MRLRVRAKATGETTKVDVAAPATIASLRHAVLLSLGERLTSDDLVLSLNNKVRAVPSKLQDSQYSPSQLEFN